MNSVAGKALVEELERILKDEGIQRLSLTTDKYDNEATLAFYHKRGFRTLYEFTSYPHRPNVSPDQIPVNIPKMTYR